MTDHDITSVRLVVNAERVVVAEARRMFTYLALFGYSVDTVITNRLLPTAVTDAWFDGWRDVQARQLSLIDDAFAPVPVLRVELVASEPVGLDQLRGSRHRCTAKLNPPRGPTPATSSNCDGRVKTSCSCSRYRSRLATMWVWSAAVTSCL